MNSIFHLYTSSGVWAIGNQGFTVTACVAPSYRNEVQWNKALKATNKRTRNKKSLKKMIDGKTALADDYKFISFFMNDKSPTYLNIFASAHMAYTEGKNYVTMADIEKILSSTRVRNLIIKQMRIFMPALAEAIRKESTPQKMAALLHKIAQDTVESKTASVNDKLLSIQAIANAGYSDENIILDAGAEGSAMLGTSGNQNLIGHGYSDDDTKQSDGKVVGGEEVIQKPVEKEMTKARYKELAKEVDLDDEFVIDEDFIDERPKP